ncbi:IS1634 family transposase, partial [Klebsiella pneumoniae]|uniref:IS1634 family transposase n=1 Tax=Klebsiella pneumoniae TaxID=573 RepID=UPI003F799189
LFPSSKLNTFQLSKTLLEQPDFELQHIYRALEVISKESDFIQSELYKNSLALSKRNDKILYYDCTNYFFEIEQEEGIKQFGPSKENKPNPIVEMGLFMDGDGIPLAFSIHSGNTNEQQTLQPLEKKILEDFS